MYDVNVHGAFFTAREAAKYMIPQGGGSIILVASMSANACPPSVLFTFRRSELVAFRLSTYPRYLTRLTGPLLN